MTVRNTALAYVTPRTDFGDHFDVLFRSSSDCLFLVEPDEAGRLVYVAVNEAGQKHLPIPWMQAKGQTPRAVLGGEAGEIISSRLEQVFQSGKPFSYQPTFTMAAGETVFDAVYTPVNDEIGVTTGVMGVARDITLQRRLAEALIQPQREKALEVMRSSFADDVSALVGHVSECLRYLRNPASPQVRELVISEGLRSAALTNTVLARMLALDRSVGDPTLSVDLRFLLGRIATTLAHITAHPVSLQVSVSDDLYPVAIDPAALEVALIDLILALSASQEGEGSLLADASNIPLGTNGGDDNGPPWVSVSFSRSSGLRSPQIFAIAAERVRRQHKIGLEIERALAMVERLGGRVHRAHGLQGPVFNLHLPAEN